jgi:hypothetical protein
MLLLVSLTQADVVFKWVLVLQGDVNVVLGHKR